MSPHAYTPNPHSLGGRACIHCGKPPTHNNHSGMGEQEPTEQEVESLSRIGGEDALFLSEARNQVEQLGAIAAAADAKRDESNFSITSANGYTTVQIKVAGPVTPKLLLAASAFMEEVQPKEEAK